MYSEGGRETQATTEKLCTAKEEENPSYYRGIMNYSRGRQPRLLQRNYVQGRRKINPSYYIGIMNCSGGR